MFYGFGVSPYVSMMRRYGQQPYPGQTPGIIDDPEEEEKKRARWRDILLPKEYGGEEVPMDVAQKARARGLGALGMSLLEGAASNDYGGSLARGMAGMRESMDSDLEQNRRMGMERTEEERRKAAEARAVAQEADRSRMAPVQLGAAETALEAGKLELDTYRERQQQGRDLRAKTGKNAEQMVAEINALAAANPEDEKLQAMAKRATGYSLGDDSDLNSLAKLHGDMTGQAFRDEDAKWSTDSAIKAEREKAAAGYGEIASAHRADRSLSIQEQYAARASSSSAGSGGLNANQYDDNVRAERDKIYAAKLLALKTRTEGAPSIPRTVTNPDGTQRFVIDPPFTEQDTNKLLLEAEREARAMVESRRNRDPVGEDGENKAPQANHARNLAVDALLAGDSEEEVLDAIPDGINGFSKWQILENAKRLARSKGWGGR